MPLCTISYAECNLWQRGDWGTQMGRGVYKGRGGAGDVVVRLLHAPRGATAPGPG